MVDPASGSSLVVSGFPSLVTAGTADSVTVTAMDAFGNVATGYVGVVQFSSSDVQAVLPADYQFVLGDDGVHTFVNGVTLKTDGSQSITVTDTVTGSITGTQSSITVNPAAFDHISISPVSSSIVAGGSQTYLVEAFDVYNNDLGDVTSLASFTLDGSPVIGNEVTSSLIGDHTVEASYDGKSDSAILTVISGGS